MCIVMIYSPHGIELCYHHLCMEPRLHCLSVASTASGASAHWALRSLQGWQRPHVINALEGCKDALSDGVTHLTVARTICGVNLEWARLGDTTCNLLTDACKGGIAKVLLLVSLCSSTLSRGGMSGTGGSSPSCCSRLGCCPPLSTGTRSSGPPSRNRIVLTQHVFKNVISV